MSAARIRRVAWRCRSESCRTRHAGQCVGEYADSVNNISAAASTVGLSGYRRLFALGQAPERREQSRTQKDQHRRRGDAAHDGEPGDAGVRHRGLQAPRRLRTRRSHHRWPRRTARACAISVPPSPRSWMIRASTGNAVMAIAAPRNSVALNARRRRRTDPGTFISNGVRDDRHEEWHDDAGDRYRHGAGRIGLKSSLRKFEADQKHVDADAKLRHDVQQRLRFRRKQEPLDARAPAALTRMARAPRRRSFRRSPAADAASGAPASRKAGRSPG